MKPIIAVLIFIFSFSIAQAKTHNYIPGFARTIHHHHASHHRTSANYSTARPSAWCGWWMRFNNGRGDPGPAFNLARRWAGWGRASPLVSDAVVVYVHHVVKVTRVIGNGRFVAISGNDGHAVRERPRSLAGAIAVRI